MKAIIIYASTHHGNTRKVAEAIAKGGPAEMQDAVAFFQEMKEKAGIREIPVDAADMDRFRFKGKQTGDAIRRFG